MTAADRPQSRAQWMFVVASYPTGLQVPAELELVGSERVGLRPLTVDWLDAGGNALLHLGVRPDESSIVLNSFIDGWGEEVAVAYAEDQSRSTLRLRFEVTQNGFRISLDGQALASFAHRGPPISITEVRTSAVLWRVDGRRRLFRRLDEELLPPRSAELEAALAGTFLATADDRDWFTRCWLEWRARFDAPRGAETLFPHAPILAREHLERARLLPSREALLDELGEGAVCAEVGTLYGEFAALIWERCRPAQLHLFDLDFDRFRAMQPLPEHERIVLHEGDSAAELEALPDASLDWIYIDGDHSYDGVRRDIAAAARKVKQDGLLIFNDYIFWGPLDFVPYGVVQGVNELCVEDGWEIVYFCLAPFMYCDVALQRRRG